MDRGPRSVEEKTDAALRIVRAARPPYDRVRRHRVINN
jgi:hypothetical protein